VLRDIPVGGGSWKNTKRKNPMNPTITSAYVTTFDQPEYQDYQSVMSKQKIKVSYIYNHSIYHSSKDRDQKDVLGIILPVTTASEDVTTAEDCTCSGKSLPLQEQILPLLT
jgi:hypothetical protein